ncbi:hypothetical protein BN159_0514 [Streptomyces davaonensis JCM 4913]|uniref:Uncharacterized protein n=1 Tax=Streptomyces davaonensis (strain DSM 101723 / JCM 4913 / KCC S-0913 / 768) TaxID=1214101 RepID=K4QV68_STRDJ|nr:hypothetical protein BN159_0514 [Streptomyces davaonensis JCM 4913]
MTTAFYVVAVIAAAGGQPFGGSLRLTGEHPLHERPHRLSSAKSGGVHMYPFPGGRDLLIFGV